MRITLGGHEYPSKKAAAKRVQTILAAHPPGTMVTDPDALAFLRDLFRLHRSWAQKTGRNDSYQVSVRSNEIGDARGFWIERADGTETDISYRKCLAPGTARARILQAFRFEIAQQVVDFRRRHYHLESVVCAITGENIAPCHPSAHVDHEPPLRDLVEAFCGAVGITLEEVEIAAGDGVTGARLVDHEMAAAWQLFHARHAGLRWTTRAANLARGAGC